MVFPKVGKYILFVSCLALLSGGIVTYKLYQRIFKPNVKTETSIIIPQKATYQMVSDSLFKYQVLIDNTYFDWVARRKKYPQHIKAGKYAFSTQQNSNDIVNMLISGNQIPTKVTFNNLRFMTDLAGKVADDIAPDSTQMLSCLNDSAVWTKYGFNAHTFHAMFIPNTYEMYWTSTPEQFVERMNKEYKRFWNTNRLEKAKTLNLTPVQVIILASIVQEETIKADERPIVAGLYLNRLHRGMFLQADPTIKYAVGDFTLKRILDKHLAVDSPYNTYKYAGLPPGPINFPEISSIDAVLNSTKHKYLYMCAREDFSGYHNFATSLSQHNRNARRYRQALNQRKIYK